MNHTIILVPACSFLDLLSTHLYVRKYKRLRPDVKYEHIEMNPLLNHLWYKYGLKKGGIIGTIIISGILFLIALLAPWYINAGISAVLIWTTIRNVLNMRKVGRT